MCKNQYYNCVVCKCPSVGSRGCQGWPLWGEACAAPCQTQSAPARSNRPTTGYDWAQQPRHWCPGENVFIKEHHTDRVKRENREWETADGTPKSGKEEEVLHGTKAVICTAVCRGLESWTMLEQKGISQRTAVYGEPMMEQGKYLSRR